MQWHRRPVIHRCDLGTGHVQCTVQLLRQKRQVVALGEVAKIGKYADDPFLFHDHCLPH